MEKNMVMSDPAYNNWCVICRIDFMVKYVAG